MILKRIIMRKNIYSIVAVLLIAGGVIFLLPHKPSFWGDELLGGVSFVGAGSIKEFLFVQGSVGPEVAPVYPLLLYLSANYLHIPMEMFRYFSALCCILSVLFIYLTVSKFIKTKQALLIAVSFSLLPIHLWYSMLLRPHALAFLLSVISFYLFTKVNENTSYKNIVFLCVINTILIFTHYIFFWIPFAECLFLIAKRKRDKQRAIFFIINFLLIGGVIFYLGVCVKSNNADFSPEKGFTQLVLTILGLLDFEVSSIHSWSIFIQPLFFVQYPMPEWLDLLLKTSPLIIIYGGNILISIFKSYLLFRYISLFLKGDSIWDDTIFCLLFFGVIFPILFGILQIVTGANLLMARYFYLSFVCKIAILYICISRLRNKWTRLFLTSIILLFFVHHYLLYRTCSPYSEWNSCAQYLQEQITEKDIILTGRFEEAVTLQHVCPSLNTIPMYYSSSINSAVEGIHYFQNKFPSSTIWLVYSMQWNGTIPCILREELQQKDVSFSEKVFVPFEGIACYKILPKNNESSLETMYRCNPDFTWKDEKKTRKKEMGDIFEHSGISKLDYEPLLDKLVFPDGTAGLNTIPHLVFQCTNIGKGDEIQTLCKYFSKQIIWAKIGLIFTLTETGNINDAEEFFPELTRKNFYLSKLVKPIWKVYTEGKYEQVISECNKLKKAGFPLAHLLETIIQLRIKNKEQEILPIGILPYNEKGKELLDEI